MKYVDISGVESTAEGTKAVGMFWFKNLIFTELHERPKIHKLKISANVRTLP